MGFRFRRSIRLGKGLRINLSKSGASLSVGRHGATMNLEPKGKKVTVGLPGTGLSYSQMLSKAPESERRSQEFFQSPPPARAPGINKRLVGIVVVVVIILLAGIVSQ
jgi:hypothetical protein